MAYTGNFGNSEPDWDNMPDKTIWLRELQKTDRIKLVRLKLLKEDAPIGYVFSYCVISVNGDNYNLQDFTNDPHGKGNKISGYIYNYMKNPTNNPNDVFIDGLFDRMRWASS